MIIKTLSIGLIFFIRLVFIYTVFSHSSAMATDDAGKSNILTYDNFVLPEPYAHLSDYRSRWSRITGFELSGLHWNNYVVIYVNKGAEIYRTNYLEYLRLYRNEDDDDEEEEDEDEDEGILFKNYELGTVFIKENYSSVNNMPNTPLSLTIMIKRESGYDSKGGDWEYIQLATTGEQIMQGNTTNPVIYQECAKCHNNMRERDYVFSTFYTEQSN